MCCFCLSLVQMDTNIVSLICLSSARRADSRQIGWGAAIPHGKPSGQRLIFRRPGIISVRNTKKNSIVGGGHQEDLTAH